VIPTILPRIVQDASRPPDSNVFDEVLEGVGLAGRGGRFFER
jgi:hypothetical protein